MKCLFAVLVVLFLTTSVEAQYRHQQPSRMVTVRPYYIYQQPVYRSPAPYQYQQAFYWQYRQAQLLQWYQFQLALQGQIYQEQLYLQWRMYWYGF
jgi:hypothetical protein